MNTSTSEFDENPLPQVSPHKDPPLLCDAPSESPLPAQITATKDLSNIPVTEITNGQYKLKKYRVKSNLKKFTLNFCFFIKFFLHVFSLLFCFAMKLIKLDGSLFLENLSLSSLKATRKFLKCILILIGITVLIVHGSKKTNHHAFQVERFFTGFSFVKDFYHGELNLLKEAFILSDYTFVMYYAPWDRQSQDTKSHFLKVASYHHEQISFVAINCWLPKSECQTQYKLREYPLLVLHIRLPSNDDTLNIPYNGPLNSHHIIRFLTASLRPLSHVASRNDLLTLQLQSKAVVVGHFDRSLTSPEFLAFYYSSLIRLQFEETKDVNFGVITDPLVAESLFDAKAALHLMLWNTTLVYPEKNILSFKNITEWLNKSLRDVVTWVPLEARKSFSLSDALKRRSVLLVVIPENPYYVINNYILLLKSVALEYFTCQKNQHTLVKPILSAIQDQTLESERICRDFLKDQILYHYTLMESLKNEGAAEEPAYCEMPQKDHFWATANSPLIETWDSLLHSLDGFPFLSLNYWTSNKYRDSCACRGSSCNVNMTVFCKSQFEVESPKGKYLARFGPVEDERVAKLKESATEEHCKKLFFGKAFPRSFVHQEADEISISGLGCHNNRTLTFLAMDSITGTSYAENLGVNLSLPLNSTGALIIDPDAESYYKLEKSLSRRSLAAFISNYTFGLLDRFRISQKLTGDGGHCAPQETCIKELSAADYSSYTEKNEQAYVVLHYSSACGECSAIAPIFLLCASLFSNITGLTFARIDVSRNILPWHLTFHHIPTIIFHPPRRKSETQVYDNRIPLTYESLLQFLLSNLNIEDRRKFASEICDSDCRRLLLNRMRMYTFMRQRFASLFMRLKSCLYEMDTMPKSELKSIENHYAALRDISRVLRAKIQRLKLFRGI